MLLQITAYLYELMCEGSNVTGSRMAYIYHAAYGICNYLQRVTDSITPESGAAHLWRHGKHLMSKIAP